MAFPYTVKVVVSGKQVEVYQYKKEVWREYETTPKTVTRETEVKQLDMFEQEELRKKKIQYSINRTKTEIKRLINSNPHLNKFMTLTFADNITDITQANYLFNQFIKRMTYRFPSFAYFAVPEFQKRGAVHYHLLCNLPYIEMDMLAHLWGHGMVNIRRVETVNNLGAYMSKYLGKELFSGRMFGKKKFFRSQSLEEPVELFSWWAMKFIDRFLSLLTPAYQKVFTSDHVGEVTYSAYTLENTIFTGGVSPPHVLSSRVW